MTTYRFQDLTERAQAAALARYAPHVKDYPDACYFFDTLAPHRFTEHGERIA